MSSQPATSYGPRPSTSASTTRRYGRQAQSTTIARPRTTAATSTAGHSADQHIVCALAESRGVSSTVGLAFINLTTAEAVLCQISDNQTYVKTIHKLHVFEPSEILFPQTINAPQKSKLLQVLEASLDIGAPMFAIARKYWDETEGLQFIETLAFQEDVESIKVSISGNFYACCCFAAALSYIEHTMRLSFAAHSMRIKYEPSEGSMMIDMSTIRALELIENIHSSKSPASLFGLLDSTSTKMGGRLLRSCILQPLIEIEVIENRYDALQELVTNETIFFATRKALRSFQDVDKALTQMVIIDTRPSVKTWEHSINHVLQIKDYIRAIPSVFDALEGVSSDLLTNIRQLCSPSVLEDVNKIVDDTLNEDVTFAKRPIDLRNQQTYAVKAGFNGLLDVARQAYNEAQQDAYEMLTSLSTEHEIQLEMRYDESRHFYFRLWAHDLEDRALPEVFINQFKAKNMIECQTLDLVKLNQKIADAHLEVVHLSEDIVQRLIEDIRADIAPLFRVSDSIAVLDLLASFAQVTTTQDYNRPEISNTLALKNARHPIAEKIRSEKFIPNDVYATTTKRLQIVTGCNMSGKSTYIRSIALITIIAQIGCFVPADYASISIRHQIFARVSIDDSSTSNVSTFSSEMRETAFILRNVDSHSLVIIDELGRGTSTRDGLAIAIAVAEALVQSHALVWFVTHFCDLPVILAEREGVVNLHLETAMPDPNRMTMLYRIADGPEQQTHYGLALARVAGLPDDVLEVAEQVSGELTRGKERKRTTALEVFQARRGKLLLSLHEQLVQAKDGGLTSEPLRQWLKRLQDEFVVRMSSLDEEQRGVMAPVATRRSTESTISRSSPVPATSTVARNESPRSRHAVISDEEMPLPQSRYEELSHEESLPPGISAGRAISISSHESSSSSTKPDSSPPPETELPPSFTTRHLTALQHQDSSPPEPSSPQPPSTFFIAETPTPAAHPAVHLDQLSAARNPHPYRAAPTGSPAPPSQLCGPSPVIALSTPSIDPPPLLSQSINSPPLSLTPINDPPFSSQSTHHLSLPPSWIGNPPLSASSGTEPNPPPLDRGTPKLFRNPLRLARPQTASSAATLTSPASHTEPSTPLLLDEATQEGMQEGVMQEGRASGGRVGDGVDEGAAWRRIVRRASRAGTEDIVETIERDWGDQH